MDDDIDFGPCCACEGTDNVFNIIALDRKAAVPGTGWGCFVCHLPSDGAFAVICNRCLEIRAEIRFAVYGYVTDKLRMKIDELTKPFGHDMKYHQADLADEYIDEFEDTHHDFDHGAGRNWLEDDCC